MLDKKTVDDFLQERVYVHIKKGKASYPLHKYKKGYIVIMGILHKGHGFDYEVKGTRGASFNLKDIISIS